MLSSLDNAISQPSKIKPIEKYSLLNFIKWNNSRSLETFNFNAKPVSTSCLKFFYQLEIIIKIIFSIYFNEFFFYFIFRWNINLQYAYCYIQYNTVYCNYAIFQINDPWPLLDLPDEMTPLTFSRIFSVSEIFRTWDFRLIIGRLENAVCVKGLTEVWSERLVGEFWMARPLTYHLKSTIWLANDPPILLNEPISVEITPTNIMSTDAPYMLFLFLYV